VQEEGIGAPTPSDDAGIVAPGAILPTFCDEIVATAVDAEADAETVEFLLVGDLFGASLLDERVPRV